MTRRRDLTVHKFVHEAMTTVFEVFIAGKSKEYARQAARAAFDEVDRVERLFNRFDPSSEISRVNRLRPGETMRVGIETVECLAVAARIQAETMGAFDINYGAVRPLTGSVLMPAVPSPDGAAPPLARSVRLRAAPLHSGAVPPLTSSVRLPAVSPLGGAVPPLTRAVQTRAAPPLSGDGPPNLLSLVGLRMVSGGFEIERHGGRGGKKAPPLDLDLGAVGKGYALDRAVEVLKDWSILNALVHSGTSTAVGIGPGPGSGHTGWPVGAASSWACPGAPGEVRLIDRALSGSGTEVKGDHIIDPRTGRPARGHPAAWAAHPSAAVSDALSTAFMVMGTEEVRRSCRSHPEVWALVIIPGKKCRIFNANAIAQP